MYAYFLQLHVAKIITLYDTCSLYFSARRYGVAHPSQHTILGHYNPASETPFECRTAFTCLLAYASSCKRGHGGSYIIQYRVLCVALKHFIIWPCVWSEITPCNKIEIFGKRYDVQNSVAYIMTNLYFSRQQWNFKVILMSYNT